LDTAGWDTPALSVNTRTVNSPSRLNRSKSARRVGSAKAVKTSADVAIPRNS